MTDPPRGLAPMMATPGALPRDESAFAFEIKWDGVRAVTEVEADGRVRMHSRNLNDITMRYPETHTVGEALDGRSAVLDGEVVAFDDDGRPSFGALQRRMHVTSPTEVQRLRDEVPVIYFVFDVLWLDGADLTGHSYADRRRVLESLGLDGPSWKTSPSHPGAGTALFEATREQGLEGVVAKRLDSVYEPGKRSRQWLKIKHVRHQDVVIGGWVPGEGGRWGRVGALLTGVYEETATGPLELRYSGRVGTGFSDRDLADWQRWLEPLATAASPFADPVPERHARFVEPRLVGLVAFTEWTAAGTLRHPSFKGRRDDIAPESVRRN